MDLLTLLVACKFSSKIFFFNNKLLNSLKIFILQQISHHPPGSALFVESNSWTLQQSYILESKLKGTNICLKPCGQTLIKFKDGNTFSYGKVFLIYLNPFYYFSFQLQQV